jgi:hypothetical protein
MQQRCYSSRRCGTVVAGAALARVAATLQRCCNSQQRRKATHYATMASGSSARGNGRQGYVALQRWQVASAEFFCFFVFFTRQFQRENESKTERKETGLRNLFPGSVGWQAPSCQLPLVAATTLAPSDSNSTPAPSGSNSTSSTSNTKSSNDNFKKTQELTSKRNLWLST